MEQIPDHTAVSIALRTGYPTEDEGQWPRCPVCGEEYETLYFRRNSKEAVGCDICVGQMDAWRVAV